MVGQSKILTVSYGTFSCTLEGFEDSFSTMKAIAEYFRDLASDDRYFGAEPPTPDADMLARIAEREIERRVEARTDGTDIVLRAADAMTTQEPHPILAATAEAAPVLAEPDASVSETPAEVPARRIVKDRGQNNAARLNDAEDEVIAPVAVDVVAVHDPIQEDASADRVPDQDTTDTPPAAAAVEVDTVSESEAEEDFDLSSVLVADGPETAELQPEDETDTPAQQDFADEDSVAAKLRRIRAVVDQDSDYEYSEDEHAEDQEHAIVADVVEARAEAIAEDAGEDDTADDIDTSSLMAAVSSAVSAQDAEAEADVSDDVAKAQDEVEDASEDEAPRPHVLKMRRADFEEALADAPEDAIEEVASQEAALEIDMANLAALDGIEDIDLDETADDAGLSDEDEAELLSELAEVERAAGADEVDVEAIAEDAPTAAGAERLAAVGDPNEAAERILDETNAQLDEPEGNRRRQAIAQLKAAVAATEAARRLGEPEAAEDEVENAFRDDLNRVVKPRRATSRNAERSDRPRPAPLKLVASQRIDQEYAPALSDPVRPRRVSVQEAPVPAADGSYFADYAESVGATELSDLLEAAASYTSFIEGREQFSRPQIIRKIREVHPDTFTREDSMRSFGTLLRQGRIAKIRGGQFEVTEKTRFRPQGMAVGQ